MTKTDRRRSVQTLNYCKNMNRTIKMILSTFSTFWEDSCIIREETPKTTRQGRWTGRRWSRARGACSSTRSLSCATRTCRPRTKYVCGSRKTSTSSWATWTTWRTSWSRSQSSTGSWAVMATTKQSTSTTPPKIWSGMQPSSPPTPSSTTTNRPATQASTLSSGLTFTPFQTRNKSSKPNY